MGFVLSFILYIFINNSMYLQKKNTNKTKPTNKTKQANNENKQNI